MAVPEPRRLLPLAMSRPSTPETGPSEPKYGHGIHRTPNTGFVGNRNGGCLEPGVPDAAVQPVSRTRASRTATTLRAVPASLSHALS